MSNIDKLEKLLNSESMEPVTIMPNGDIVKLDAMEVLRQEAFDQSCPDGECKKCDSLKAVHSELTQLRELCREQHESILYLLSAAKSDRDDQIFAPVIAKYEAMQK